MNETPESTETVESDELRQAFADAFERDLDPLAEHAATFEALPDPFMLFETDILAANDLAESTRDEYTRVWRQWSDHMDREGRHPACPNENHARTFIEHELCEREHTPRTVKEKLVKLNRMYRFLQNEQAFPTPQDYNPFNLAREKVSFGETDDKEPPRVSVDELRDILADVTHVRERGMIIVQLKLGLRATEVCNIQLQDIDIQHSALRKHYPEMGTNPMLDGHENAVYVPSRHEREGNKSKRPRILPLDDELRRALIRYLLVRPTDDEPWLFLSLSNHCRLTRDTVNDAWKDAFRPEYDETDEHRAITSHFGRHYFTTFWRVEQDLSRELVQYMRGDKPGNQPRGRQDAIDVYLHTYYEDIEQAYRENIYKLNI